MNWIIFGHLPGYFLFQLKVEYSVSVDMCCLAETFVANFYTADGGFHRGYYFGYDLSESNDYCFLAGLLLSILLAG